MTASAVVRWDAAISMWFATNDSPVWFRVMQAVSVLHTEIAVTLYGVALAYLLFVKREGFWSLEIGRAHV